MIRYRLTGRLHTDGDFTVDMDKMKNGDSLYYHDGFHKFIDTSDGYFYYIDIDTKDVYLIRDFLATLAVSFDVHGSHYYVLGQLFNMVDKVYKTVFNNDMDFSYESISGNYQGTELVLIKEINND